MRWQFKCHSQACTAGPLTPRPGSSAPPSEAEGIQQTQDWRLGSWEHLRMTESGLPDKCEGESLRKQSSLRSLPSPQGHPLDHVHTETHM